MSKAFHIRRGPLACLFLYNILFGFLELNIRIYIIIFIKENCYFLLNKHIMVSFLLCVFLNWWKIWCLEDEQQRKEKNIDVFTVARLQQTLNCLIFSFFTFAVSNELHDKGNFTSVSMVVSVGILVSPIVGYCSDGLTSMIGIWFQFDELENKDNKKWKIQHD